MKSTHVTRVLAAGIVLSLAGVLAACSTSTGTGDSSIPGWKPDASRATNQIHVYALGDAAAKAEQALATTFNKTSKVKVVVDNGPIAGAEYTTTVRSQIGTKNAPDIFMSWSAAGIQPLVTAGGLLPLDSFIKSDPKLKSMFLPSVFNQEVIKGSSYGVPMRGVAPVFVYYNKSVLAANGLKPASSWSDLLDQVKTLSDAGVTPFALGGADNWPDLMWFEYLYSREIGNDQVAKGLAGDTSVWSSAGSKKALADIAAFVKAGGFGSNYGSVHYGSDGSAALLRTGKAAYELMGSWEYATIGDVSQIGWTSFPSVSGGSGDAKEISGNLSNYYNVNAQTRYPDTVKAFLELLYGSQFQKAQLALGNLPPTTDATSFVDSDTSLDATAKDHLTFISGLVKAAPSFQLSWDQAAPASQSTALAKACADYISGAITADQYIQQMQTIVSASK